MTTATRATGAIAAVCLLAGAACSSDGDDTASATSPTADPTTTAEDDVDEGASAEPTSTEETTAPAITEPTAPAATTEPDTEEASESTSPDDVQLLDFEFQPVPAGRYRVETLGAPFLIDVPEGWWVQPNSFGYFVITDAASRGPGDRDIVMIRPSNLADPDQPGAPVDEQAGDWPLDDIDGWLDALVPGVVDGEPVATTIGGLGAVQFDVAITDDVDCGEAYCVGFTTNRLVNGVTFDRGTGYRVWWIDGGEESPIAITIGDGSDPEFTTRAEAVLDTMTFESIGPNPIPSEGNLWELGIPSDVPAGRVTLPVGPGVTFELSEPHFVVQNEFFSRVLLDGPGEVDIFFPDEAFDGASLATVDDVVEALERDPGLTATIAGTREVGGYEATEVDITGGSVPGPDTPPLLGRSALPDGGWRAPPDGTLWIMETPDGIAVISAEWVQLAAMVAALALADEILDSIVIGG
jgi:hypothetical protein